MSFKTNQTSSLSSYNNKQSIICCNCKLFVELLSILSISDPPAYGDAVYRTVSEVRALSVSYARSSHGGEDWTRAGAGQKDQWTEQGEAGDLRDPGTVCGQQRAQ